jgi:dTDP-D-glucose 4,6-dehydratase
MHVKDLVSIVKSVMEKGAFGEIFHAGGGGENVVSLREICLTFNEDVEIKKFGDAVFSVEKVSA